VKQIRQYLKDGTLDMSEVPLPPVGPGDVLVRTHFSFVSVGTEKMKVTQARMNLAEKAAERPDQVKQVIQTVMEQGLMPTVRKVQERLKAPSTLGYSCAGVVAAVGSQVDEFRIGDRVAAIGEGVATHSEYNTVPRNLVVAVPPGVSLEHASCSAVGAIALQAVRQAKLELGETVAVIGLGLLGQFLVQLCRANGCRVIGVDPDTSKQALAIACGAESACAPTLDEAVAAAQRISAGQGVDAVMITTAIKDKGPIEMTAAMLRDRGRAVCLGNTYIELDWRTWFAKEIDFLFSRAMGPGIFDMDYFLRGKDYPVGYVRWSANRNMGAVLELIAQGRLDLRSLVTHRFPFAEAPKVFDGIASGELSSAVGIVFEYPEADASAVATQPRTLTYPGTHAAGDVRLGVIGAGNYAKSMILPHFPAQRGLGLEAICTARGANADALAKRYGFRVATTDAQEVFANPQVTAVMVATRHDSHARYAAAALQAGKHVYVEKPLAMNEEQLAPIVDALAAKRSGGPTLWLGHNRRYAPLSRAILSHFTGVPVRQVTIRVRSGGVPGDSWYQDPAEGGGVLFGDVCHFIDLAICYADSLPVEIHALATPDAGHREESWAIQMRMASGGIASVHYTCGSQDGFTRESADVLGGGRSATMSGFTNLVLRGGGGKKQSQKLQPDMGQATMVERMIAQFRGEAGAKDETDSFVVAAQALLAAQRSIRERRVVTMDTNFPYAPH
jgi:predicted dehydrogenase